MRRLSIAHLSLLLCALGYIYLFYSYAVGVSHTAIGCPVKSITSFPCPSCGVTRSVMAVFQGNFLVAMDLNPLGFIVAAIMVFVPLLIIRDYYLGTSLFGSLYKNFERLVSKVYIALPLIAFVVFLWIRNIMLGI